MAVDIGRHNDLRKRIAELAEMLLDAYEDFDYYKDTTYRNLARPAIFWSDGKSIGYGYASHISGSAREFFAKFRYWGFDGIEDFYCLPIQKRNEFLQNGKAIWEQACWADEFQLNTAHDLLNIWRLDNTRLEQVLLSLTKTEHEFHEKLVQEAKRIKNECYSDRRLRWKIRNEKARFKAEDKLRERTQSTCCGSCCPIEGILVWWFRLDEGIKRLVGLRERFPPR